MVTMSEKFNLQWNDFYSNVSKSFGILRDEAYLHDVTLVGDDHKQFPGHKLVLSACSEYFKEIFKRNKHSSPLLCLEGVFEKDIKHVMDYMYNGEVSFHQEDLDRFLSIAQRLKLEGLLEQENIEDPNDEIPSADYAEEQYHMDSKSKVLRNEENRISNTQQSRILNNQSVVSLNGQEIDEKVEENLEVLEDGHVRCRICGKESTGNMKTPKRVLKQNMKSHIEMHIEGLSYTCQPCGKEFRCRNSLGKHKSLKH